MIKLSDIISLENESELEELIKLQKEKENGDMFDETYMQLKQDQLIESKKENDKEKQENQDKQNGGTDKDGSNEESSDSKDGEDNGGGEGSGTNDTSSDTDSSSSNSDDTSSSSDSDSNDASSTSDTDSTDNNDKSSDTSSDNDSPADKESEDILKGFDDVNKEVDESKAKDEEDKKKEEDKNKEKEEKKEKDDKNDMKDKGVLKMPSKENFYNEYDYEYLPLRLKDNIFNNRKISSESFSIGEVLKPYVYSKEKFIDTVSIEELLERHHTVMGEAVAISMSLQDILRFHGGHNRYSFEDISEQDRYRNIDSPDMVNWVGRKLKEAVKWGAGKAEEGLKKLGNKAFEYGEIAMRHVSKNVVALLDKTLEGLHTGTQVLIKYIKERPEQYKRNRALLTKAGEIADELSKSVDGKVFPQRAFDNEKIVNSMKINGKFNPSNNTRIAFNMAKCFFETYIEHVTESTRSITNLINIVKTNLGKEPSVDKAISIPMFKDFIKKNLDEYKSPTGMITVIYKDILPGDLLLIAFLPDSIEAGDAKEKLERAKEIYKETSLFLGVSTATYQKNAAARYIVDIDELKEYISLVKQMCDYCIQCQDKLETYNKLRDNIKKELKDYSGSLFKTKEEVTVQNSLIEYFTPNIAMLDNLSTKGTYVVDTYLKKHIAAATEFINLCLKHGFTEEGEGIIDEEVDTSDTTDTSDVEDNKENTEEASEGNEETPKEENTEEGTKDEEQQ